MKLQTFEAVVDHEVLDWESLSERCLGRVDLVEKVLAKFETSLDADLRQLEEAILGRDTAGIAHIAHRIKGMSLTVSAAGLARWALHLEESARGDESAIEQCVAEIRNEAGRIGQRIGGRRPRGAS